MASSTDPLEETAEELYERAPVGYLTARLDGTVTRVNETLAGWLGRTPGDLIGQRIQALLSPGGRIFYETHCAPILRVDGVLRQVALDLRRADGTHLPALVDWRQVNHRDGQPAGYRIMIVDATERRSYEREILAERQRARAAAEELARLNAELEERVAARTAENVQLQKFELLGSLTGGFAHDFNNLLTPIMACLDILSRKAELDERNARLVVAASEAAERARLLVSRLLAFARRQRLEARAVDLLALIEDLRELVERSVGPHIELSVQAEPSLPAALVDPGQLELALLNLCVNARDAMNGNGRIAFRVFPDTVGAGHPTQLAAGTYVAVSVTDTGSGMDPTILQRAVEPFFTTKGPNKGTGLGLSMAKGLAQQSGGELMLESEPGRGTTVTILLPAAELTDCASSVSGFVRPSSVPALAILLVDDEPLVRASVARMLHDLGHEVREAASGSEAMEVLREWKPDLLVTDHAMSGMTGAALAAAAREKRPDLPVLLLSGFTALAEMEGDSLPCLPKPFSMAELSQALDRILAGLPPLPAPAPRRKISATEI